MTIPVISMGKGGGSGKDKPKDKKERVKVVKKAAKMKAKPKAKSKVKRAKKSAVPRLDQVPAVMAPPPMKDTRPVPVKEPPKGAKPSVPGPAIGEPGEDTINIPAPAAKPEVPVSVDTRLVQGADCIWLGPLEACPDDPNSGKPVCPHCGGNLITSPDRATVELGLEAFELGAYSSINPPPRRHPGYKDLVHWVMEQPRCFPTIEIAAESYREATGKLVDPSR